MHSPAALGLPADAHGDSCWTVDFRARLTAQPAAEGSGMMSAVARDASGTPVAHAAIFHSDVDSMSWGATLDTPGAMACRPVGLLAHVWTAQAHRRRGLSGRRLDAFRTLHRYPP